MAFDVAMDCGHCTYQDIDNNCPVHGALSPAKLDDMRLTALVLAEKGRRMAEGGLHEFEVTVSQPLTFRVEAADRKLAEAEVLRLMAWGANKRPLVTPVGVELVLRDFPVIESRKTQ